jgi:carbon monoxide dehydrogenase subunit G
LQRDGYVAPVPSQSFRHTARSDASPATVWAALDDETTWTRIPGVDRIVAASRGPDGTLTGFTFQASVGGQAYTGKATLGERVEPERVLWLISSPDLGGSVGVTLSPDGAGTSITVDLTVRAEGFLASMLLPLVASALGRGFPEAVEEFAASFVS